MDNVYCPTAECQLDQFISLGLCDSCTSQDASLDGNFWNGAAQHEDEYQGCINTAQFGNNETEFRWNYTGMKDHVAAGEPVRWERKCIIRKPGYPELDMRIITDYIGGEAWPKVGVTNSDLRFSNGYRLGIIRLEQDLLDRSLRLYTALNSDPVWNPSNSTPQIEFCIGDYERFQDGKILDPYKLPLPAVSAFTCFKSTSDITRVAEIDRLGLVNGTTSHCKLSYCAKRYSGTTIRNTVVSYDSLEDWPLHPTGDDPYKAGSGYDQAFRAEGLNETFYIGNHSTLWLGSSMSRILKSTTLSTYLLTYFMHHTWPDFFQGLAQVGSKVIQGPGNFAAINNTSEAYGPDIFVDVKWAWLAYPLALLVYSTLFLLLTALGSRRRSYLFKNSILAVLVHGLEGWDAADCPELLTVAKERNSDLKRALGPVKACLAENDDGLLKLKHD
ncbi:hypothetical protein J4E80_008116 [Alternaria sp. BMP 0032]|nr:hypothetical protein J4E80_008116 [Alternaria sp. BMP 0032]